MITKTDEGIDISDLTLEGMASPDPWPITKWDAEIMGRNMIPYMTRCIREIRKLKDRVESLEQKLNVNVSNKE